MLSSPACQELAELRQGADAYAERVSRDFEELTWLRSLAEQLDSCDAASPLGQVAERILPELQTLIRAETVALVGPLDKVTVADKAAETASEAIFSVGNRLVEEGNWRRLIEALTANTREFPLVCNQIFGVGPSTENLSIHSCIVVPVARQDVQYGWLIALNRLPCDTLSLSLDKQLPLPGDDEFGTEEAGLLHSAARALATHARNAQLLREKELLLIGVIRALINAIDAKDTYTWGHSDRVALIARRLAEQLQLEGAECERLYTAGLLHDIGKIGVPDGILQKQGPLTDSEFEEIKRHPQIGYGILQHLQQLGYVLPGVLHHHESVDGRGYPHGLQGDAIPLFGRILAVADSYDAMTSSRPYRSAMSPETARSRLREGAGRQWDARVVAAFLDCSTDIQRLCSEARGEVLHKSVAGSSAAAGDSSRPYDALQNAVFALSHQCMP
jgi:HD-GYP domain-containing protein (c-di-GMP phosphodiesterase class II)